MYDLQMNSFQLLDGLAGAPQAHSDLSSHTTAAWRTALALYRQACLRARLRRLWARLTGAQCALLDLRKIQGATTFRGSHDAGLQTVPLHQIRGSENRAADFDNEFCPRRGRTRDRWVGLAMARQEGTPLPPVKLIRVGDIYFVRDGHHRISVARALGEEFIEATVTAWQLAPAPVTIPQPGWATGNLRVMDYNL